MFPECFFGYPVRKLLKGKITLAKWVQCVPLDTCFAKRHGLRLQCKTITACVIHSNAVTFKLQWKIKPGSENTEMWWWGGGWGNWWRFVSITTSKWNETIISIRTEIQPPPPPPIQEPSTVRAVTFMRLSTISHHDNNEALYWKTKAVLSNKTLQHHTI